MKRFLLGVVLLASGVAVGHDTWLLPNAWSAPASNTVLLEATSAGSFPKAEHPIGTDRLLQVKVRSGGQTHEVTNLRTGKTALEVRLPAVAPGVATVWMETKPRSIELTPAEVAEYLAEIGASETVGKAWLAQPEPRKWRESYRKLVKTYVRVGAAVDRSWSEPAGLSLELIPESDPTVLGVGDRLAVRVLHDGAPLAGLAVFSQAAGEKPAASVSDAQGRVTVALGKAGAWLVRGTVIAPAASPGGEWRTEMATLTFGVGDPTNTAITEVLDREAEAFRKGDLAGVTACWETEETSSVIESGEANWGWADYRDHHLKPELAGMKITSHERTNLRIVAGSDLALATFEIRLAGTYKERAFDLSALESVVLRRRDGVWRIVHVHESAPSKRPAPPPKRK